MISKVRFLIVLSIPVILILIKEAYTIKCWNCVSEFDPKCSDPFDNQSFVITDCDHERREVFPGAKATMCRKIRQKVHGVWKYFRDCGFIGEPGIGNDERFCLMRTGSYNIFMEYCTCNTKDGCNTSSHMKISWLLLLFALFVPVYFQIR